MSEQGGSEARDMPLAICAGCGIVVNPTNEACAICRAPYPPRPPRAAPQPDGLYWAGVRVTLTCRACGFPVPVDHLAMDGGVPCNRCGIEQRFDPSWWESFIRDAQAIGDVGRGDLDFRRAGQSNLPEMAREIAKLGRQATVVRSGERALGEPERAIEASPGNPLCASCGAPVVVAEREPERLTVACPGCKASRRYQIPSQASRFAGLVGIVADASDADRPDVRVEEQAGTVLLRCPGCAAPLEGVGEADRIVTCAYCNASCRVSLRAHQRAGHQAQPPATWWLLFGEPSALRGRIEAAIDRALARADKQRRRAAARARQQAEPQPPQPPPKRPPWYRVKDPGVVLLVTAIGFVLGGFLVKQTLKERRYAMATAETTCRVLDARVITKSDRDGGQDHYIRLQLEHEVDGRRYTRVDTSGSEPSVFTARQRAGSYQTKRTVPCRYNPRRPELVLAFSRGHLMPWGVMAGFALIVLLAPVFVYGFERRRYLQAHRPRRKRR